MKKLSLLAFAIAAVVSLQAQWVDDPSTNTRLAIATDDAGEIYISTDEASGYTYFQWADSHSNGWSPTLQCVDVNGVPQWGENGIHINSHNFNSWSSGTDVAATTDKACVTCFQNDNYECIAIKINVDGSFAWGEQGISVFDFPSSSSGCTRTQLVAGTDGGVWAMAADYESTYVRYINADGTLNPTITISESGYEVIYGQLTLGNDNIVFVTYEMIGGGMWYVDKQIWVAGYTTDGSMIAPAEMLMGTQCFGMTYIHDVVPDQRGGGYAYIFHSGINEVFNVYVFHFDANGHSTIDPIGAAVHSVDLANFYGNPDVTVDPTTNDAIVVYKQSDASTQSQSRLYMNRITDTGERLWDEGILIGDNDGKPYSHAHADIFPDGSGFMISYFHGQTEGMVGMTVEAIGYDMDGTEIWRTTMNNVWDNKTGAEYTTGFHNGQNIYAWTNQADGKIYGQNIDINGNMGPVVVSCLAPENLVGEYNYNEETTQFGALITWLAPEADPLHYNLYRYQDVNKDEVIIEVPTTETSYFDEVGAGNYTYKLTAVYEDCESDFALTAGGDDHVDIVVTTIDDNKASTIVEIQQIYTINGQAVRGTDIDNLSNGLYIIKGKTCDGQIVNQKIVISNK